LAGDENEEVIVFQVCIAGGVEKWEFDLPALFRKVVCDVWCDNEETRLLFARPERLGLNEQLGSNPDLGFHGNEIDYNDPRNSCLNFVLDRRTGIPIALSVVYIEVARRLGQPVSGVGLPGHFVIEYNDGEFATYIDPFHSGKLLSVEDCRQLARDRTGADADATALAPVGARYILVRMLNNLRSAYFRGKQFDKMVAVTDLLIEAFPRNAEYYKARGVARLRMRQFRNAQKDLELYLQYSPDAEDRAQITQQLGSIHRWLGRLN